MLDYIYNAFHKLYNYYVCYYFVPTFLSGFFLFVNTLFPLHGSIKGYLICIHKFPNGAFKPLAATSG